MRVLRALREAVHAAAQFYRFQIRAPLKLRRDDRTGLLYQQAYGHRIYLKSRHDHMPDSWLKLHCDGIFYRFYRPTGDDVVVDVGAGFGHEAMCILSEAPGVRYYAIEVQPSVYEPLCNTLAPLRDRARAIPFAISDQPSLMLASTSNYAKASTVAEGCVEVQTIGWKDFLEKYQIDRVDFLKINIEGGERDLLPAIGDFRNIKRIMVSAHDFRANRGEGEHFRTREFVTEFLTAQGYSVKPVREGDEWLQNWLYAERRGAG